MQLLPARQQGCVTTGSGGIDGYRLFGGKARQIMWAAGLGAGAGEAVADRLSTGNVYVNRNMIGAVVGVQPFGGHGLSGTGPKAGGPHYLARFATEQTITINTSAAGGNAALMTDLE